MNSPLFGTHEFRTQNSHRFSDKDLKLDPRLIDKGSSNELPFGLKVKGVIKL